MGATCSFAARERVNVRRHRAVGRLGLGGDRHVLMQRVGIESQRDVHGPARLHDDRLVRGLEALKVGGHSAGAARRLTEAEVALVIGDLDARLRRRGARQGHRHPRHREGLAVR